MNDRSHTVAASATRAPHRHRRSDSLDRDARFEPERTPSMTPDSPAAPGDTAPGPLTSLARHWLLTLVLAALGLGLGLSVAVLTPVTYTASARLAVAPNTNNAYTIPGFPQAARDLAADYARWVQNNATDATWRPAGVTAVSSSPIPESGVILIETQAGDAQAAVTGAQQVADRLAAVVNEAQTSRDPRRAYTNFANMAPKVAAAEAKVSDAESSLGRLMGSRASASSQKAARDALVKARTELSLIQLQQSANSELYRRLYADTTGISQLKVIAPAAEAGDDRRSLLQRWGLLGLAGGLGLALVVATGLDRLRTRRVGARSEIRQ